MKTSTEILVADLESYARERADNPLFQEVLRKAKNNYYHEYKSNITAPIGTLVSDLVRLSLYKMVQYARDGKYDATTEESKKWMQREGFLLILEGCFEGDFSK